MSSARQAVIRWPSVLTGWGYRPDLTPAHQVDLLTGITAGMGGTALGLPMMCHRRRYPVSGRQCISTFPPSRRSHFNQLIDAGKAATLGKYFRGALDRVLVRCHARGIAIPAQPLDHFRIVAFKDI